MIYIHKKSYYKKVYIALLITLFVVILFSCSIGAADLSMVDAFKIIIQRLPYIGQILVEEPITNTMNTIIWKIRMPRVLLAGVVGAALAFSVPSTRVCLRILWPSPLSWVCRRVLPWAGP